MTSMLVEYQPRGSNHSEATTPDVEMEPERFLGSKWYGQMFRWKLGSTVRINGLFHPLILTFDPNFLWHRSRWRGNYPTQKRDRPKNLHKNPWFWLGFPTKNSKKIGNLPSWRMGLPLCKWLVMGVLLGLTRSSGDEPWLLTFWTSHGIILQVDGVVPIGLEFLRLQGILIRVSSPTFPSLLMWSI